MGESYLELAAPMPCQICGTMTTRIIEEARGIVPSCSPACDEPWLTMESLGG